MRRISLETIKQLEPGKIVFIKAPAIDIYNYRLKDSQRYRAKASLEEIEQHQELALNYAIELAQNLNIPFAEVHSGEIDKLEDFLEKTA